jgi:hypothetical protein
MKDLPAGPDRRPIELANRHRDTKEDPPITAIADSAGVISLVIIGVEPRVTAHVMYRVAVA